jgi:hypothetical protein
VSFTPVAIPSFAEYVTSIIIHAEHCISTNGPPTMWKQPNRAKTRLRQIMYPGNVSASFL